MRTRSLQHIAWFAIPRQRHSLFGFAAGLAGTKHLISMRKRRKVWKNKTIVFQKESAHQGIGVCIFVFVFLFPLTSETCSSSHRLVLELSWAEEKKFWHMCGISWSSGNELHWEWLKCRANFEWLFSLFQTKSKKVVHFQKWTRLCSL